MSKHRTTWPWIRKLSAWIRSNMLAAILFAITASLLFGLGVYALMSMENEVPAGDPREYTGPRLLLPGEKQEQTQPSNTAEAESTNPASEAMPTPPTNSLGKDFNISKTCSDQTIPHKVYYRDDSSMYIGEMTADYGKDGVKQTCTHIYDGKDWGVYSGRTYTTTTTLVYQVDSTINRGTKPQPDPTPPAPTYTYEQALSLAQNSCIPVAQASGTSSSAYQQCIQIYMSKYGY